MVLEIGSASLEVINILTNIISNGVLLNLVTSEQIFRGSSISSVAVAADCGHPLRLFQKSFLERQDLKLALIFLKTAMIAVFLI